MARGNPVAFLSYVRDDDAHDFGGVSKFRERLEGEVKIQSGQRFEIFQDRNDIRWGQFWQERITDSLLEVTFLIPIITPSFLVSPACRSELETFLRMEQTLGLNKLILPVYYVSCDALDAEGGSDPVVAAIKNRNWTDWRSFRFKQFEHSDVRAALADLAKNIKASMQEFALVSEAAQQPNQLPIPVPPAGQTKPKSLPAFDTLDSPPWSKGGIGKLAPPADQFYWAYTLEFDEIVTADQLIGDAAEAVALQSFLAKRIGVIKHQHAEFFKSIRPAADHQNDFAITLLLDNSGSLRGSRIVSMAAWTVILSEWFDVSGIKHEILGYTTRTWQGGQSRQKWLADGKPFNPGRVCDLRHIIYKSFDEPASVVAANCAIMMRELLLKENIDGEALLWANTRLENERAKRKLLFVLSDGAPLDDATLSANPGDFLSKHLAAAAGWIKKTGRIELRAVGVEFDNPFYANAEKVEHDDTGVPVLRYVFGA